MRNRPPGSTSIATAGLVYGLVRIKVTGLELGFRIVKDLLDFGNSGSDFALFL